MHKKNNWIPASIPPAQDGLYLTTSTIYDRSDEFKGHYICQFKDGIWEPELVGITVLAWQPLPALYKAGD